MNQNNFNIPQPGDQNQGGILDEKKFSKYFLIILFGFSLLAFINVIKIFFIEIILAAVFSTLFYPVFNYILKLCKNKRNLAAFISCVLILLVILVPAIIISNIVVLQAIDLYHTSENRFRDILQKGDAGFFGQIRSKIPENWLSIVNIDSRTIISNITKFVGINLAKFVNKTSKATLSGIIYLFIILFSIFYFLRDGQKILIKIKEIIPLSDKYKEELIMKFNSISRATVKGTLLIALIQSFLGTMVLLIFGVNAWMLWGVVMLVFAVIPFVGTGAVLIPAGIFKIIGGDIAHGITIICISVFFISLIDNFLRPRLVGHDTGLHDLLVFFSSLGGISMFGPAGFIIGPLITALFLTILDIYSIEFKKHIEYSKNSA